MENPSALPAAPLQRPRVLVVGTAYAAAASVMVFIGLLAVYLTERAAVISAGDRWLPDGSSIPLQQPNTMMITLLMSVVTVQWAVNAIARNDRVNTYIALGLTFVLGGATILMLTYLWSLMDLEVAAGSASVLIYTISAAQLFMLAIAMIFVALMAFRALGGQFASRQHDGITAAALYWHTMVAVFFVLWLVIYITK